MFTLFDPNDEPWEEMRNDLDQSDLDHSDVDFMEVTPSGGESESMDHLFLQCDKVWMMWTKVLHWWGAQCVTPKSVIDLLIWWTACV